jgi:hypothetical protein
MKTRGAMSIRGEWWKYSRYELINGTVVPAPDATLVQYDPWQGFWLNDGKYRTVRQPYQALLELGRQVDANIKAEGAMKIGDPGYHPRMLPEPMIGPKTVIDRLVLDWCNHHGLLGILPVLCSSVLLPAQVRVDQENYGWTGKQHRFFRLMGEWYVHTADRDGYSSTVADVKRAADDWCAKQETRSVWFQWNLRSSFEKPLDRALEFFPAAEIDPSKILGVVLPPGEPGFWKQYGEPIVDLAEQATDFWAAVRILSLPGQTIEDRRQSLRYLESFTCAIGPSRDLTPDGSIVEHLTSAGLLASYAQMFLWDYMAGRRAVLCGSCGKIFVSNAPQATYCSTKCRTKSLARRHYIKKKGTAQ